MTRAETEGLWQTKYESWEYEEEVRVICTKAECIKKENLYFKLFDDEISLKGIVIGPLSEITVKDIEDKLPVGTEISVTRSQLAFRSFNIETQRKFGKLLLKK